jgi:hypothetical protein
MAVNAVGDGGRFRLLATWWIGDVAVVEHLSSQTFAHLHFFDAETGLRL